MTEAPEHPDHGLLSALLSEQGARAEADDFSFEQYIRDYIDPTSLATVAMERSMLALGIQGEESFLANQDLVMKAAGLYHDAFMMGARFERSRRASNRRSGNPAKRGKKW